MAWTTLLIKSLSPSLFPTSTPPPPPPSLLFPRQKLIITIRNLFVNRLQNSRRKSSDKAYSCDSWGALDCKHPTSNLRLNAPVRKENWIPQRVYNPFFGMESKQCAFVVSVWLRQCPCLHTWLFTLCKQTQCSHDDKRAKIREADSREEWKQTGNYVGVRNAGSQVAADEWTVTVI